MWRAGLKEKPALGGGRHRWDWQARDGVPLGVQDNTIGTGRQKPAILVMHKRDRNVIIAKVVWAEPLGEWVLAMPYRNRRTVQHVSLPPEALRLAREMGCRRWIVRLDQEGLCYSLPLDAVERLGWLRPSEGRPEWFVELRRFEAIAWQTWPYVERIICLDSQAEREAEAVQLALALEV